MAFELNGLAILEAQLLEPRIGNWTADVEIDVEETFDADELGEGIAVTIEFGAVTFTGAVHRGGLESGRWIGRIVGGAGGLATTLEPKNYAGVVLADVVDDLMTGSGETLASDSDDLSTYTVAHWHRTRGPASHALQAIADELGVPWAVTRAGTVRIGPETALELDVDTLEVLGRPDTGSVVLAPEADPDVRPGQLLEGRQISYVATLVESGRIRQEVWFDDSASSVQGRIKGSLQRIIDAEVGRRLLYAFQYPCTVAKQAGDGSLELLPDDLDVRGAGLGSIVIRTGMPGWVVAATVGSRCMLGFEAGDPKRPYVAQWLSGTDVTTLTFDGGTQDIARTTDTVNIGDWRVIVGAGNVTAVEVQPPAGGGYVTLPVNPAPGTALSAEISSGNSKLKA
jgi:hypothetical protein